MADPITHQRPRLWFGLVVLGHAVLISAQLNSQSGVPLLERLVLGLFSEVQRTVGVAHGGISGLWTGYLDLRGVHAENDALRDDMAQLRVQIQEQRALAARGRELQKVLGLRDRLDLTTRAADVIGVGPGLDFRTVTIDKGTIHGLRPDMAVLAPEGVVGRVVTPSWRAAKVQLLVDRNAAAGAMIERTRVQGVVLGTGEDLLRMSYLADRSELVVGDRVVTSGKDGIYPGGFVIGHVEEVQQEDGAFRLVTVRPAVDWQRLESLLVVMTRPEGAGEGDE